MVIPGVALLLCSNSMYAQNPSGASSQSVVLAMSDVLSSGGFSNSGGGSGGSATVNFPLSGASALSQGIESSEIQMAMQCNAAYDVSISASSTSFSYNGTSTFPVTMNVRDVLSISITGNNTGGTISNGFSQFQFIDGTNAKLAIASGQPGVSTFSFKYKALPGFSYPAGIYTTNIVFTIVKK